jgi:ankyrin repeat protein
MSRTPPESHRATGSGEVKNFFHVAARIVSTGDGDVHWGRRTYVETELRMLLGSDMPTLKTTSVRIDPQSEYGIVNMWPLNDDGDKAAGGLWQQTPPPGASSSRGRRVFGWQRADSSARERGSVNRTYTVHYVDVMTSIVEICAQEIYTALIAPISSSADFAGLDVALSGKGADRRLVGDRFAAVRNSFVDLELGTTSDAVLCLLSAFRDKLRITHTQEDVLEIVMECLSTTDWKAMEQFLRWAVVAFEADDLKRIIRATAEFYRRAMVHQRQLDFCAEGIRWLASKVPSSFLSEDGIIRGYEAVIQRVRENGFPEYAPEELLRAIGLEYKSGAEETDDVNGLTVEGHGGKGHFDIIVNETGGRSDSMVTALYLLCGTPILLPEDPEQRDDVIARLYPDVLPWAAKHFEADLVTYAFGMSSNNAEDNPGTLWSSVVLAITSMFSTPLFRSFSNHSVFRDAMNGRHCLLYSPIINAVELGDYDLAYLLGRLGSYSELEHGFRIGVASAAFRDDLRMVHHLIPNGTTEEKEVFAYQRLLFRSAWDGSLIGLKSAVAGLRRRNAKIDHKGENGQTALSIAARMGDVAGVEYLLSLGEDVVDPCTQDDMRWTPLSWALKEYPLAYATKLQDYEAVVRSLLNVQTSWNDDRFLAADSEGRTPISLAALTGSEELLMSVCMNFEYKEEHLMDSNHRTPLSLAANLGFAKIVRRLLDTHGCKPNIPDLQGQTALHLAAACDRGAETVEALLEHRSLNPNAQDLDGRTPLLVAAQHRHTRSVRALLKRKDVKIGIPDHSGRTPLSYAAESRSTATVAALVERCSEKDLNAEDLGGWTPLCWAIYRPRLKVINLLVRDRRVRVPHPALEDEHGSKLVDVAVQSAREFLLKLGVWRMWEDGDGNQHWDKVENPEIAPPEGLAEYLKEGTDDEEEFYVGEEGVDIDPQEASQLEGSIGSERREEGSDIGDMDDTGAEEKNTGPEKEASDGPGQQLSDEREADGEEKMTGLANKTANGPDQ